MRCSTAAACVLVSSLATGCAQSGQQPFDVVVRGGQLLDGTGTAAVRADLGIRGDRIAAVGQLDTEYSRWPRSSRRTAATTCRTPAARASRPTSRSSIPRASARRARSSGLAQEIGPLNPYERRIVHLAVAEVESVTSESIGAAFEKTVIISTK